MAFFVQDNLKGIGHFSRLHGYSGKLVISFINENPLVLTNKITIWLNVSGLITPFKIQEIQPLNKNKLILTGSVVDSRISLPKLCIPVPASSTKIESPARTSTQGVLPP